MPCLIPEAKRDAVARGLTAAFGTAELDAPPVALAGGLSGATLLRIRVGGVAYVLRLEPEGPAFGEPTRAYACMRAAAQAMLAPRVWYADAGDGLAIMDCLPQKSLALDYPGDGRALIVELAQALRALHDTPGFPAAQGYLAGMDDVIATYAADPLLSADATAEALQRFAAVRRAYRTREADEVSSHNDLNPGNVIYDGRRLWLVDWEVAFRADRFADLASVANWFTSDAAGEDLLLATYFGVAPDAGQRARFEVMRQVNHLFYGLIFLIGAAAERPGARLAADAPPPPTLLALRQGLASGRFTLGAWDDRVAYGRARLAQALEGLRSATFAAALDHVAA